MFFLENIEENLSYKQIYHIDPWSWSKCLYLENTRVHLIVYFAPTWKLRISCCYYLQTSVVVWQSISIIIIKSICQSSHHMHKDHMIDYLKTINHNSSSPFLYSSSLPKNSNKKERKYGIYDHWENNWILFFYSYFFYSFLFDWL